MGPGAEREFRPLLIEQSDGADAIGRHALDHIGNGFERDLQIDIRGQTLEYTTFARSQQFDALAFGDVRDTCAQQPPARLQARPTYLARNLVARRVAEDPLEHGCLAIERALQVLTNACRGLAAIGLRRCTQSIDRERKQCLAIHLEEAHRILVHIDQPVQIGVDDDDDLGSVLHQRAITRLAVAQRRVRDFAFGGIAQTHDERPVPVEPCLADTHLSGKIGAIGVQTQRLVMTQVHLRILESCCEFFELLSQDALGQLGQQKAQRSAEDIRFAVAEHSLTGGIDRRDVTRFVDGDDRVFDVVENRLELAGRALA